MTEKKEDAQGGELKKETELEEAARTEEEVDENKELQSVESEVEAGGEEVPSSKQETETEEVSADEVEAGGGEVPVEKGPEAKEEAELEAAEKVEARVDDKEAEAEEEAQEAASAEDEAKEEEPEASEPETKHAPVYATGVGLMQRRKSYSQESVPNAHRGYNPKTSRIMLGIIAVFFIASFILAAIST